MDLNLTRRIARCVDDLAQATVVEIGPGPGGLTRALLDEGAKNVIAIERDARCIPLLQEIAEHYPHRLTIVEEDALRADYGKLVANSENVHIAANLPYGISTALLTLWLEHHSWPPWYSGMTLMFQKEVAQRIVAQPGTKAYGRLSVLAQWRTETKIVLRLPPQAFTPPPKVESAVVSFRPRQICEPECDVTRLQQVTKAAFGQRRKMIKTSLKQITNTPETLIKAAAIDPNVRAENLTVSDFCNLANAWHKNRSL